MQTPNTNERLASMELLIHARMEAGPTPKDLFWAGTDWGPYFAE